MGATQKVSPLAKKCHIKQKNIDKIMPAGVYGYAGTFGDTKPAQTHFNWYIDGVLVWDATAI